MASLQVVFSAHAHSTVDTWILDSKFKRAIQRFGLYKPKLEGLIYTKQGIRENLDKLLNPWIKDIFLHEIGGMIYITLIIKHSYWHFRFQVYHDAFRYLEQSMPIAMSWELNCQEIIEGSHFGKRFQSVLTT